MSNTGKKQYYDELKALILSPLKFAYRYGYQIFSSLRLYLYTLKQKIKLKRLPEVIQMPITNRCNLKCSMCNVPACKKEDISHADLDSALKDPLFEKVISVGVNGGEPFLKSDFEQYISSIISLPSIRSISIISNGILTKRILEKLEAVYSICSERNIRIGVTFSLDGCETVHDGIRGAKGAFKKTINTINSIMESKKKYCDTISIICTISKYNIYSINELIAYAEINDLPVINYQLAVNHRRLDNENLFEDFSVLTDEYIRLLATEFFYSLYSKTKKKNYYAIYYYLLNGGRGRLMKCLWQHRDVTLDASGDMFYCAVESEKIGSIYDDASLKSSFFSKSNLMHRKSILKNHCDKCIHYSADDYTFSSHIKYYKHIYDMSVWSYRYIFCGRKYR